VDHVGEGVTCRRNLDQCSVVASRISLVKRRPVRMPKACTFRKINKFRELSWYGLDVRVVTHVVRTPNLVVDALANGVEAGG